jgi:hypothetical protein
MSNHKSLVGHFSADGSGRDSYLTATSVTESISMAQSKKIKQLFNSGTFRRTDRFPIIMIPENSIGDVHIPKAKNFFENSKYMLSSQKQRDEERAQQRNTDIFRKNIDWNEKCFRAMRSKSPEPLPLLSRKVVLFRTRTLV